MSNIQKTIQFLNENPDKHFIAITGQDTGNTIGAPRLFLKDIANGDLTNYIKYQLGSVSQPTRVWVELRRVNGTSSQKMNAFAVEVTPDVQLPAPKTNDLPASVVHEAAPMLGNPMQHLGLGLGEIIQAKTDAALLIDARAQLKKSEDRFDELLHEHRKQELELRQALTDVSKSEAKEQLAIMMVKAENKNFFDSPAFQTLMEKAPEMMANFAAIKSGNVSEASMLGNPDLSTTQKEFINYVIDNLNDTQIEFLGSVFRHMNKVEFVNSLTTLINQFNAAG